MFEMAFLSGGFDHSAKLKTLIYVQFAPEGSISFKTSILLQFVFCLILIDSIQLISDECVGEILHINQCFSTNRMPKTREPDLGLVLGPKKVDMISIKL